MYDDILQGKEDIKMGISNEIREMLNDTKANLSGYKRRHFMAQAVQSLLDGKPYRAEQELGWDRKTVGKALDELAGGFCYIDQFHARGRKRAEYHHPDLLTDIREIADRCSQTDPTFQTTRLYLRLSAAAVREQLIEQKGYADDDLPSEDTIRRKLIQMGYRLRQVKKVNR